MDSVYCETSILQVRKKTYQQTTAMEISLGIKLILSTLVNFTPKWDSNDAIATIVQHKIRVLIFPHNPFVFYREENKSKIPSGLDILILDNFAKRHGYQIEYIKANDSLSFNVFNSENQLEDLLELIKNS